MSRPKRVLAIGDLHGCLTTLKLLINMIDLTQEDELTFCGDYVDRGTHIPQLIDYLIELKEKFPNTKFCKGNHDDLWIRYLKCELRLDEWQTFQYNGGGATINQYDDYLRRNRGHDFLRYRDLPEKHQIFFGQLENIIVDEKNEIVFVHAGLRPEVSIIEQNSKDLLWIRDTFIRDDYQWGDFTIVHGHTPMTLKEVEKYHQKIPSRFNVDTGCVFGYNLSCVDVLTGNILSVRSQETLTEDVLVKG